MINKGYACAETLDVLQNIDEIYVKKIPTKFIEMLRKNASKQYVKHINPNINIQEQKLSKDTLNILAIINLKYWVNDEEHKKWLLKQYKKNGKINNNITENIEINEIFTKKNEVTREKKNEFIMVRKEKLLKRIVNKIKSLFKFF